MRALAMSMAIGTAVPAIFLTGGCSLMAAATECHAEFRADGPYVRAGEVWDDLRVWCSPSPVSHAITAQFDYRRFEEYSPLPRSIYQSRIPDAAGFTVSPHAKCVGGWYRATAKVTATNSEGETGRATLVGIEREFSAAECLR